jgi:hypothetical protein
MAFSGALHGTSGLAGRSGVNYLDFAILNRNVVNPSMEGTERTGNRGQTGATDRVLHPVEPLAKRLTVACLLVYWCMLRAGRGLLKQVSAPVRSGNLNHLFTITVHSAGGTPAEVLS